MTVRSATVVICTRDRRERLLGALQRVAEQRWSGRWDVLVVDNGSSDNTSAAVAQLAADLPVHMRCVGEPRAGLSHARNRALREATGDVVIWTDDDTEPAAGWLAAHAAAYATNSVLGVAGRIIAVLPADTSGPWRAALADQIGGPTARYDFGTKPLDVADARLPYPFGANMSCRRRAALAVGGFRADLGWGPSNVPGEETEFFERLDLLPGRVRYEPRATVAHRIEAERLTVSYFERWHRGRGRAMIRATSRLAPSAMARQLAKTSARVARYRIQESLARDLARRLAALRLRAQAEGRLIELAIRVRQAG